MARKPAPGNVDEVYSLTKAEPVPIAAKKTRFPLIVYGDSTGLQSTFVPSGMMGDAESLRMTGGDFSAPTNNGKPGETCLKIETLPKGREGWLGVYWQTPANNWGKIKGAGYDLRGAEKLTFWARGEKGGERIVAFKMGGLVGPYPDTDSAMIGPIRLTKEWTKYSIDLKDKDLRHIVGGFAFNVRRSDNPRGALFYLDEIAYEGPAVAGSSSTVIAAAEPVPSPEAPKLQKSIKVVIPFPNAKAVFVVDGRDIMDEITAVAMKYPDAKVVIEGHTDNVGSVDLNKKLSYQRAKSVADYMASKGVSVDRMTVTGLGGEVPLHEGSNNTAEGRMENRRVEVTLKP